LSNARELGELGERFVKRQQPSLEAQIANIADEIAYNNHDLDDGLRAELIALEDLRAVPLFEREYQDVCAAHPNVAGRKLVHEIVRRMISHVVSDLITTTSRAIEDAAPQDIAAVRAHSRALVGFSADVAAEHQALKRYLRDNVYRHYRVLRMTNKAQQVIRGLFDTFFERPELLPTEHHQIAQALSKSAGDAGRARAVSDYIAGMTDRYAIVEYERLFDPAKRS
jgi:dGTPase